MVEFKQHGGRLMAGVGRQVYYPIDEVYFNERLAGFYYRKTKHFALHRAGLSDEDKAEIATAVNEHAEATAFVSEAPHEEVAEIVRFTQSPTIPGDLD